MQHFDTRPSLAKAQLSLYVHMPVTDRRGTEMFMVGFLILLNLGRSCHLLIFRRYK